MIAKIPKSMVVHPSPSKPSKKPLTSLGNLSTKYHNQFIYAFILDRKVVGPDVR